MFPQIFDLPGLPHFYPFTSSNAAVTSTNAGGGTKTQVFKPDHLFDVFRSSA